MNRERKYVRLLCDPARGWVKRSLVGRGRKITRCQESAPRGPHSIARHEVPGKTAHVGHWKAQRAGTRWRNGPVGLGTVDDCHRPSTSCWAIECHTVGVDA